MKNKKSLFEAKLKINKSIIRIFDILFIKLEIISIIIEEWTLEFFNKDISRRISYCQGVSLIIPFATKYDIFKLTLVNRLLKAFKHIHYCDFSTAVSTAKHNRVQRVPVNTSYRILMMVKCIQALIFSKTP